MADHEISKLMWIAVVVALAASIYFIARPQINTLATTAFDNVEKVVQGIKLPGDSNPVDPNAKKYDVTGVDYSNGGMDTSKPMSNLMANGQVVGKYQIVTYDDGSQSILYGFAEDASKNVDLSKPLHITLGDGNVELSGSVTSAVQKNLMLQVDDNGTKKESRSVIMTINKSDGSIDVTATDENGTPNGVGHSIYGLQGQMSLKGSIVSGFCGLDINMKFVEV